MNINKNTIDITKLVDEIHAAEERGRYYGYADYVTGLYTLRAWLRGKLHRKNPPAPVRDFNRSMEETNRAEHQIEWDAVKHNQKVAEKVAKDFWKEVAQEEEAVATA